MNSDIKTLETLEDGMYSVTFSPDGSGSGEWLKLADDDDDLDIASAMHDAMAEINARFDIDPDASGKTLGTIRAVREDIGDGDDLDLPEFELTDQDEWSRNFLANYLDNVSQTKLKRSGKHLRQHNLARKRNAAHVLVGLDLVSENAHLHGSRAMRRKALHDGRKGTKPGPFGRGSVKLTDVDLVERHGRAALVALSEDRFQKALAQLNADGRRLDLKPKSEFQKTVDALSEVLNRRVSV
ncbi:hypothetical protein [Shinella zoogloeoides]|uniref:hypothetical protein n=1 Tax=Shinella zoogloeoides TaxID=352475 RepID=UPI0028A5B276|nr:hypothetical protein [Shinella zoogloeoides]